MAYMRHEKVDLVSLLVRRRLSSACQKARGRETSVKEKGLKTSGGIGREKKEQKVRPERRR